MIAEEKLLMLLNEPIFYQIYQKQKSLSAESRQSALKRIYVNQKMVRRYKALMQARYMAIEDLKVDQNIDYLIRHLQSVEENCADRVLKTENEKDELLDKFSRRELREAELRKDMHHIQQNANEVEDKLQEVKSLKARVDKTLERTEVVKALALENKALKQQNQRLRRNQTDYHMQIERLKKQVEQRNQEIRFLRSERK